jgi:hypothetical protein
MATFQDFENNLKTAIDVIIQKNYADFVNEAGTDATTFLNEAKNDLVRWTGLFAASSIDKDEFTVLVESDKDLLELHALKQAGLAQARWDLFVNSVIQATISVAMKTFV